MSEYFDLDHLEGYLNYAENVSSVIGVDLDTIESTIDWNAANEVLRRNVKTGFTTRSVSILFVFVGIMFSLITLFCMTLQDDINRHELGIIRAFFIISVLIVILGLSVGNSEKYAKHHKDKLFCGIVLGHSDINGRTVAYKDGGQWKKVDTNVGSPNFKGYNVGDLMQLIEYKGTVRCVMHRKIYKEYYTFNH